MKKETMDIMAALNLMSNSKTAAGDFMIGTQTLADAFKSAFVTGDGLDPLGNCSGRYNPSVWADKPEVKTAPILTIQNYEKLVGYLRFYDGCKWEVTSVVEDVEHYRIRVINDSGLKCFVYDLARVPDGTGCFYSLRNGAQLLAVFKLHELQSPLKLFNTLCKILDNKTN
jgi:hypothetical protein